MDDNEIAGFIREQRARNEIHDVLMRSCRGVDRLDRELILSAYHPDAIDDHGSFAGSAEEFVDWVFANHTGKVESCVHHLGNIWLRLDGDVAFAESYVLACHRRVIDGVLHDLLSHGRYVDRFERRDGEWRIAYRKVVFDWDRLDPVERQWGGPLTLALAQGRRSREDPSYQILQPSPE
jgi:hypothetical protein